MTDILDDLPDPAFIASVLAFLDNNSITCGNCGRILLKDDFDPSDVAKLRSSGDLRCPFCGESLDAEDH